jgi:serine/threonine protein kinase
MGYKQRWEVIRSIDGGGQGSVSEVFDRTRFNIDDGLLPSLKRGLSGLTTAQQDFNSYFDLFRQTISKLNELENPYNHGALKILHPPGKARDPRLAEQRLEAEIHVMREISHPNLLKLLDADPGGKWFVSQYYPKGTLYKNRKFVGRPLAALHALRPLVEGVALLHKMPKVHRDIKPQNIFVDAQDNLVLGDFGLIFANFEEQTRISETFENVGSRDWMPPWAMGIRIEEIRPTFDVFSLGKVLWAMLSTSPVLQLWYHQRDAFNLEKMFPGVPAMNSINVLLHKCIVELEEDCLKDASLLLSEMDQLIQQIELNADLIHPASAMRCKMCGKGKYEIIADRNPTDLYNFGIQVVGSSTFKVYSCSNCGNVQLFHFGNQDNSNFWDEK